MFLVKARSKYAGEFISKGVFAGEEIVNVLVSFDYKSASVVTENEFFSLQGDPNGPDLLKRSRMKNKMNRAMTGSGPRIAVDQRTGLKSDLVWITNGSMRPATLTELVAIQKIFHGTGFEFN